MTTEELIEIRGAVRERKPLIHCITNHISIHECANAILSQGARPIMAEHPREVEEISRTSQAVMLNMGNITDARIKSMFLTAATACRNKIPFVLDIVGVSCSTMRRKLALKLIGKFVPDIIKGNYSEIKALGDKSYKSSGVDADGSLDIKSVCNWAIKIATCYNSVVLASGKVDIVTDGNRLFLVKNGTSHLASVTGTGCMLGALCACFISVTDNLDAAMAACAVMGICGQLSPAFSGQGSFVVNLMDKLYSLSGEEIEKYMELEEEEIEKL